MRVRAIASQRLLAASSAADRPSCPAANPTPPDLHKTERIEWNHIGQNVVPFSGQQR